MRSPDRLPVAPRRLAGDRGGSAFLQIRPRRPGEVAQVSRFLQSSSAAPLEIADPVSGEVRAFAEHTRRLEALALLCGE